MKYVPAYFSYVALSCKLSNDFSYWKVLVEDLEAVPPLVLVAYKVEVHNRFPPDEENCKYYIPFKISDTITLSKKTRKINST